MVPFGGAGAGGEAALLEGSAEGEEGEDEAAADDGTDAEGEVESLSAGLAAGMLARRWREAAASLVGEVREEEAVALGLGLVPLMGQSCTALCVRSRLYPRAEWSAAMQRRKEAVEAVAKARASRTAALASTMGQGLARIEEVVSSVGAARQRAADVAASRVALLKRRSAEAAAMDRERLRLCRSREFGVWRLKHRRARLRREAALQGATVEDARVAGLPDLGDKVARLSRLRGTIRGLSREIRGGRWEQVSLRRLHGDFVVARDATTITDYRQRPALEQAAALLAARPPGVAEEGGGGPTSRGDPLPPFASEDSESLWVWRARLRREAEAWGSLLGLAEHSLPPEELELEGLRRRAMDVASEAAEAETHRSYRLLRGTAASWRALGIRSLLSQWQGWAAQHKAEREAKRVQRRMERRRAKEEAEALEQLRSAERAKWEQKWDDFNECWYWEHRETGETRRTMPEHVVFLDRRPGQGRAGGAAAEAEAEGAGEEEEDGDGGRVRVGPKGGRVPTPPWLAGGVRLPRMDQYREALEAEWTGVTLANEHAKRLDLE